MEKREIDYWSLPEAEVLELVHSRSTGLTTAEAADRLRRDGENTISKQKKSSEILIFLQQFKNPIVLILFAATLISAFSGDWIDAGIILLIVFASSILSYFQEHSAGHALEELRAKVQIKSQVYRDGVLKEVPARSLVKGDVVRISTGSLVPGDGLILENLDLQVNQSILTGESLPGGKKNEVLPADTALKDRTNCVFMGTNVQNGSAKILIVETGEHTAFGQIAEKLTLRPPETEFERGIRHFGYLLTQIMLILTLVVFAINVINNKPAIDSLLFSVALAVGITPQLLPAIISLTLSQGSRLMAKEGVIVRRLNAIENFGSMDTLCTDKTGTLTEGIIRLDGAYDPDGEKSDRVFRLAYFNAFFQTGMANSLDDAIVQGEKPEMAGVVKLGEIPFDFDRERLSVIVEDGQEVKLITKGAINSILGICRLIKTNGAIQALDEANLATIHQHYANWSSQGIRVLGVAEKLVARKDDYDLADETDMVFAGFLLLFDHPKADVAETIRDLTRNGVSLRIITGDNQLIAVHTAESVGIKVTGVLTGEELHKLSEEALWHRIEATNVFAEVDPNQKERIILALKKKAHVVGYMGDGINDVPALHAADVSISVDNAADIAKESADLVLLENELKVLNRGIILGRTTFTNTLKYIQVTTSANFGNMFSMAGVSLFLPFLPLLPKQILLINFLTDIPAITIAQDSVDAEVLEKPRRWDMKFIRNFMFVFGFISSLFDYITFGVLILIFKTPEELFQSSWFIVSVLTELLILMVMRTRKPFFKSRPAPIMLFTTLGIGLFTLVLPYLPFHQILNIEPMDPLLLAVLMGISLLYILTTEITKIFFFRKYGTNKS